MGAPGAAMDVVDEARPWWESRLCLALVVFATMLPLLYPPLPPLVDLFGHMGRYRVEIDLGHSPWLRQYYDYHWALIGNLGVDFLVRILAPVIGLEPAVKLIVTAIPPLTAIGFLWVAKGSARAGPADRVLRAAIHLRLSVPVRLREFRAFGRAGLSRLRSVAAAWAARAHAAQELAVRPDLARCVLRAHLRLGAARTDVLFGRCGAAARPRPLVVESRDRGGAAHVSDDPAAPRDAGLAQRDARRPDLRLVQLEDQMALDLCRAARPLEAL